MPCNTNLSTPADKGPVESPIASNIITLPLEDTNVVDVRGIRTMEIDEFGPTMSCVESLFIIAGAEKIPFW